jgi:hypothetical protein
MTSAACRVGISVALLVASQDPAAPAAANAGELDPPMSARSQLRRPHCAVASGVVHRATDILVLHEVSPFVGHWADTCAVSPRASEVGSNV